jgi:uncharacterized protein YbdZ (MbtH family)
MAWDDEDDTTTYRVLISEDRKTYSILPDNQKLPPGWRDAGFQDRKRGCLEYIRRVWTDARLLSLREIEDKLRLP